MKNTETAGAQDAPALYTFDLTPTLKLNRDNPSGRRRIWDMAHFVTSVQGIANRKTARLYVFYVGNEDEPETGCLDHFWLDHLREDGAWLSGRPLKELGGLDELIEAFRDDLQGLVVYDEAVPATSNVASTAAGVQNLACIRWDPSPDSLYHWLTQDPEGPQLPVKLRLLNEDGSSLFTGTGMIPGTKTPSTGSAKCDAYIWAKEKYLDTGLANPRRMGFYLDAYWIANPSGYIPNHTLTNHDYFISKRGFLFDLSPWDDETPVDDPGQPLGTDVTTLKAILRSAWDQLGGRGMVHVGGFVPWDKKYTDYQGVGGKHGGVPAEWRCAEILSCHNAYLDADALGLCAIANASVFQHFPLQERYPQRRPTLDELHRRGLLDSEGRVADRTYVTIYVGDYDAAAWLYQRLPKYWNDPQRGSVPLGWAFNPNLADRFAPGMDWVRRTATSQDFFITGDSGAGYVNPGHLVPPRTFSGLCSGLDTWEKHCERYYRQWDISISGFLIDGYAPPMTQEILDAYARFSPDGITAQKVEPLSLHGSMPVVQMTSDLDNVEHGVSTILEMARKPSPAFAMFRTVLWTPTQLKEMHDAVKTSPEGENVAIVDPYSFFLLARQFLTKGVSPEV